MSEMAPAAKMAVLFSVERPAILRLVVVLLVQGMLWNQLATQSGNVRDNQLIQAVRILALVSVTTKADFSPVVANLSLERH